MTDATTRIKNLSIALEAVSKVTDDSLDLTNGIYLLLDQEVKKAKEKKGLNARPAKTSPDNPLFNT